ncbi:MAG: methyltransferase domain-containing protein [Candidatus Aenigmatarchaeota archaeon]
MKKITKSRFISINDGFIDKFEVSYGFLQLKRLKWDFIKNGWWSRPYEYKLIADVTNDYFGREVDNKIALDFGCGPSHPGVFILEKLGFSKVYGCDLFDKHKILQKYNSIKIEYFKDCLSKKELKFDLITSISVLEHMDEETQGFILTSLIEQLNKDGVIVLTFDMPGFEHKTNLELYKNIFVEHRIYFEEEVISEELYLNNFNSIAPYNKGWPEMNIEKLNCYRLIGYKIK